MGDSESIEEIRERKLEELRERADSDADTGPAETPPDEPVHVDGEHHLAELVADHDTVLVDFYADWCGPCQMLAPEIEDVAAETDAAVAKVDIDTHQGLAAEYNVQGVPTMLVISGGDPVERVVGVRDADELADLIEQY